MIFYECWKGVLSLANLSGQLMFKLHIWFGKQFLDCGGLYAAVKATCFSYSLVPGTDYWRGTLPAILTSVSPLISSIKNFAYWAPIWAMGAFSWLKIPTLDPYEYSVKYPEGFSLLHDLGTWSKPPLLGEKMSPFVFQFEMERQTP